MTEVIAELVDLKNKMKSNYKSCDDQLLFGNELHESIKLDKKTGVHVLAAQFLIILNAFREIAKN